MGKQLAADHETCDNVSSSLAQRALGGFGAIIGVDQAVELAQAGLGVAAIGLTAGQAAVVLGEAPAELGGMRRRVAAFAACLVVQRFQTLDLGGQNVALFRVEHGAHFLRLRDQALLISNQG